MLRLKHLTSTKCTNVTVTRLDVEYSHIFVEKDN